MLNVLSQWAEKNEHTYKMLVHGIAISLMLLVVSLVLYCFKVNLSALALSGSMQATLSSIIDIVNYAMRLLSVLVLVMTGFFLAADFSKKKAKKKIKSPFLCVVFYSLLPETFLVLMMIMAMAGTIAGNAHKIPISTEAKQTLIHVCDSLANIASNFIFVFMITFLFVAILQFSHLYLKRKKEKKPTSTVI